MTMLVLRGPASMKTTVMPLASLWEWISKVFIAVCKKVGDAVKNYGTRRAEYAIRHPHLY